MKPKWVATLYAGKFKAVLQFVKNSGTLLLLGFSFLMISCDNSDDLETIRNESPIDNESPFENESPTENEPDTESIIVYTDIMPDFISDGLNDSYGLDLNNDQIEDFRFSLQSYGTWRYLYIASNSMAGNGIMSHTPWYSHPVPLNSGKEIYNLRGYKNGESYETWGIFTLGDCHGGDQDCPYNWLNKVDRYLGLKFKINGQIHYGWARLDVASYYTWIIKDYAFNATPNKPILAGQIK